MTHYKFDIRCTCGNVIDLHFSRPLARETEINPFDDGRPRDPICKGRVLALIEDAEDGDYENGPIDC